jgi:putative spermidine/putrescine transport system permease protein
MASTAPLPPHAARTDATARIRRSRNHAALLAVLPLLLFLLLFFVGPIVGFLKESFYRDGTLTLAHYRHVLDTPIYRIVLGNTFTIAAAVTLSCVVMSYPLAYLMATVPPAAARLLFFAVLLPFWSSALVRTAAWIALLGKNGSLNTLLTSVGILDAPIAFLYNFTGVMIGMTHVLMPFVVLPLYASFRAMDITLVQAAQSLGARSASILRQVVLPLTSPGAIAGAIIVFMNAVGYYITPSLMGGPG